MYHNCGKPNMFRVYIDGTLCDLKDHLKQINIRLNHEDATKSGQCKVLMSINSWLCLVYPDEALEQQ